MNVDKDRKDTGINHIIYALLLTFLFVVCFAGFAVAEPTDQPLQASEAKVLEGQHAAGDTTDSAPVLKSERAKSDKKIDTPSEDQPKKKVSAESDYKLRADSKSDGQLHLDSYQDPGKTKEESSPIIQVLQTIFDFIKYVFYLAIVLAVGFLAIYGVKMFTTKYNTLTGGGNDLLNILEVKYLAPGKAVCLVEIADKVLVLGLAGNNINQLSEFVEIEQVQALKQAAARKPEALQPFQAALEKLTKRFTAAPAKKSRKPVRKRREAAPQEEAHWSEELHSTGDNIRKLLEDIKEQDTKKRGSRQSPKRDRGEKRK
ncbi:MAG: FliO/MopB family protein [Candidatus Aquicultor sp.]